MSIANTRTERRVRYRGPLGWSSTGPLEARQCAYRSGPEQPDRMTRGRTSGYPSQAMLASASMIGLTTPIDTTLLAWAPRVA